jgi:hypothetical protein
MSRGPRCWFMRDFGACGQPATTELVVGNDRFPVCAACCRVATRIIEERSRPKTEHVAVAEDVETAAIRMALATCAPMRMSEIRRYVWAQGIEVSDQTLLRRLDEMPEVLKTGIRASRRYQLTTIEDCDDEE